MRFQPIMDKIIKTAVESAEKEFEENKKESKIKKIKDVVKRTLERIEKVDSQINVLQEEKKILKMDIDDLKAGRLDKIEERQLKSDTARKVSIFIVKETVIREQVIPYPVPVYSKPWWSVEWNIWPNWETAGDYITAGSDTNITCGDYCLTDDTAYCTATTRDFSTNVVGTYTLNSGTIKYLQ